MNKFSFAFACATALIGSTTYAAAQAESADARAKDGIDLFKSFCVVTGGDKSIAIRVWGEGNVFAKRLPEATTTALQGQPGGVAWAMSSPRNAQLLLAYHPAGICEVRIADADEPAVVEAFRAMTASLNGASTGHMSNPETRVQNGANLTYRTFDYELNGRKAHLALTTSDRRVGEQQHLITFGFTG